MEFRILGPVEVHDGGVALDLGRPKQRALLGLLLLRAEQAVSADRLVEELWNGRPPAQALASLQSYVSNLRRVLEPERRLGEPPRVLVRGPGGYAVQVDPSALDAARFEAGLARARRAAAAGDHASADRLLDEALALWRDEPLAGLADDLEPIPEIGRLSELRLTATEERFEAALTLGRHAALVADLEAFVQEHPLRERARGQLALALYRVGRQADALDRLRDGRRLLSEGLGLAPSPALRELEQQILQQAPELRWAAPPEPASEALPASMPRPERTLVGRAEELASLAVTWQEAGNGRGAVALISGEPGIGKTRLAEELAALAAGDGALVCWGTAFEGGGAPPYWPWTQVLEAATADLSEDALRSALPARASDIARLLPQLSERLALDEEPIGEAGEARFRLHDAVARFLVRLASGRPLVIVLDDLHWADAPALELVRWVARRVRAAPILLVGTYRDTAADRREPLAELLAALVREAPLVRVGLEGLSVEEVSTFVAQQLAARPPEELARSLHAKTDGNAFYLSELVRYVQSRGDEDGAMASSSWEDVPNGIREVIERRVSRLPAETVAALEAAAVVGREFELEIAAAAQATGVEEFLELIEPALAARIVEPAGEGGGAFRFAHALVRETVYAGLPYSRHLRLHGAVAAALERLAPDAHLSELAFHYERAAPLGLAGPAVDAALAAARRAEQMLGFEQAEEHLRQALRLLSQTGDPEEREPGIQVRLAAMQMMTSGYSAPGLAEAAARVRELATRDAFHPELTGVLWALWTYQIVRADIPEALRIGEELQARGQAFDDAVARAAGLHAQGATLLFSGHPPKAIPTLEAALADLGTIEQAQLERAGLGHNLAIHAHCHTAHALSFVGRMDEAEAHVEQALTRADQTTRPFDHAFAAIYAGWLATLRGDLPVASEKLHEAMRLCEDHGFRQLAAFAGAPLGWVQAAEGDVEAGIATMRAAIDAMEAAGVRLVRHWHLALLATALISAGRDDEAHQALDQGIASWQETGAAIHHVELFRLKGDLLLRRGDARGVALLEQAVALAEQQGAVALEERARSALRSAPTTV